MHLKRQKIPKNWPVKRKGTKYVVRPNFGTDNSIPLLIVLRDIQMNSTLRQFILEAPSVESDDAEFPEDVKNRIEYFSLNYLECQAKICEMKLSCDLDDPPEKEVYAQTVAITSTLTEYNPKQLKLFCWEK